ncbi:exodeoxyribonuclease V subunit gamma [Candidatus Binatus sp.]|uniref:exodeoxyribonuclease V subunit gamma n=1 Tax=Candidatus Binatus sp. TaxID=2811406 RepID=UPI003C498FF9
MIRLHYSNRLENLIAPLAEAIAAHQKRDPLERVSIVVPNRVVEQFVRYRLAETIGVAANLRFPFLRSYLAELLQSTNKNLKILEADDLQLVLFECLRSTDHRDDQGLKPTRDYILGGSKTDADVELRTLLLAAQLARLFREYSISRRRMIGRWRAAQRSDVDAMSETERWQRHLWQLIFDSHGRVREEWIRHRETRLMMLPDAFEATEDLQLKAALPGMLHVFSSSYAGNAYADIFARLGALCDVRIYALNPCREFWEDVDTSRRSAFAGWPHRQDKVGEKIDESEDPFSLNESSDPPALRLWGRPGREYIRLLNELSQCDFAPLFSDPVSGESETGSVLEELQQNILDRAPQPANIEEGKLRPTEARISFLACPGIRREAEIVANEIWSILRNNEKLAAEGKAERIRFHEIAVLIPDSSVDDYAAHIESVFRKQHRIPIDLVSRTSAGASRVAEAVELLLQLPSGRFSRAEMIRLLTHPGLNGVRESGIDVEKWRRWSETLGIFFGADDYDLKDTYIPPGLYHWDQAIKRLALGTMMTGQRGSDPAFYAAGASGPSYIPGEVAQDELKTAALFIRMARSLIADAISIRDAHGTPREWSLMLGEFVNAYIRPEGAIDEQVRDRFLEAIEAIAESELNVGPMSFESAREVVAARVTDLESRRGQYSGRGVAIGSFTSLRSIPFKVIFALGLNDAMFPERDRSEPLDLRKLKRTAGDVSPAERDRYLFLETILAARERIFFSYVARNAKTGDELEPSPVIRELQSILRGFIDKKTLAKLTVKHPISRYDLKYFPEFSAAGSSACEPEFESFDPDARRGARMLALRKEISESTPDRTRLEGDGLLGCLGGELRERVEEDLQFAKFQSTPAATNPAAAEEIALPIAAIRRYLECPLQGAARYSLGMLEDEEAPEDAEDEPVQQSRLNRTVLLRTIFWRAGGTLDAIDEEYAREVRIAQARGRASAGQFAEAAKASDDSALREWIAQASGAGVSDLDRWKDIRIGRADEFADVAEMLAPISLNAEIQRHDGTTVTRRVSLYGTIRGVSPDAGAAINCVLRKSVKSKDFLPAFLNAIVLAASGAKLPAKFRAIVIRSNCEKKADWIREFKPLEQNSALAYLTAIVGDLLSTGNSYFLPIEAIEDVVKQLRNEKNTMDLVDIVEQVLLNNPPTCSSDFGPVRNPRDFDPPDEKTIEQIVARRFNPIIGIFE